MFYLNLMCGLQHKLDHKDVLHMYVACSGIKESILL